VELLSLKLKANQDIHGIIINEVESLISLYADDTFLILDGSENSLREALESFESFYKVSGLKMNSSKTKVVWVGNKKYSDQIICPNMRLKIINKYGESGSHCRQPLSREKKFDMWPLFITQLLAFE
jgi:hypothetical protein